MKITLAAIGKFKSAEPEQGLALDYLRRAQLQAKPIGINDVNLQEIEIKAKDNVKERESEALLNIISSNSFLIVLDENGKDLKSRELAALFEKQLNNGCKEIIFAIGGADGHANSVKKRADFTLAFSKLTWPHKLIRAMASEQIYRAMTILTNSPYHRD